DAELGAPEALSASILREAQAKARPAAAPAPTRTPSFGTRLWIWLAQPAVGAGLASVMVGTVIGLMWWERPLQDASPRETATVAAPAVPAPTPPPPAEAPVARDEAPMQKEATDTAAKPRGAAKREAAPVTAP